MSDGPPLRTRVVQGGAHLLTRRAASMVVQVVGVIVLTGIIGAADYGRYAGSVAVVAVIVGVATFGIDTYLVRAPDAGDTTWRQAYTLLLVLAPITVAVGLGVAVALEAFTSVGYAAPMTALVLCIPVQLLALPANARLARSLEYRTVAVIGFVGDIGFYAIALPLAALGAGVWAPVAALVSRYVWNLVAATLVARPSLGLTWHRAEVRAMLGYGAGFTSARLVTRLSGLVNPLLVGHVLGAAAVGQVALAQTLVDRVSFAKDEAKRLALAAYAKVQDDRARLEAAHQRATAVQSLVVAVPLAGFVLVAPWLVPEVFGDEWPDVPELVALLGINVLVVTLFNLETSLLHVVGRNNDVVVFRVVKLALFAGSAAVLVNWIGILGYGWAQVIRLSAHALLDRQVRRVIEPHYRPALYWVVAAAPVVASPLLPWPWRLLTLVPLVAVAVIPRTRQAAIDTVTVVWRALRGDDQPVISSSYNRTNASI